MPRILERAPSISLRAYVEKYLEIHFEGPYLSDRILPIPGKGIFLTVTRRGAMVMCGDTSQVKLPEAFLFPQTSCSGWLRVEEPCKIFLVVFRPGSLRKFFNRDWEGTLNVSLPFRKREDAAFIPVIRAIRKADRFAARYGIMDEYLKGCVERFTGGADLIDRALSIIHQDLSMDMKAVAAKVGCSPRHLRRAFNHGLGISPKGYQQIYRIHCVAPELAAGGVDNLARFALDHGFSDQAHFCRIFRMYTGKTPRRFNRTMTGK